MRFFARSRLMLKSGLQRGVIKNLGAGMTIGKTVVALPERTCVVTVTYGERFELVRRVVEAVLDNGVGMVIIVDNGSATASRLGLRDLAAQWKGKVSLVEVSDNLGSAGGYKLGLQHALMCDGCEYIWFLDDDNMPAPNALAELLRRYPKLSESVSRDLLALMSYRKDRGTMKRLVAGASVAEAFRRKSSFMGVHILDLLSRVLRQVGLSRMTQRLAGNDHPIVAIPYGPYGGLFAHRSVLQRIGLPDERFFVYCDDVEYTYRLTKAGGRIYLIPSSVLNDLDVAWASRAPFPSVLRSDSDFRAYYSARNHAYFEKHYWRDSVPFYVLNKCLAWLILATLALWYRRWSRLRLLWRAVHEGEAGDLGPGFGIDAKPEVVETGGGHDERKVPSRDVIH